MLRMTAAIIAVVLTLLCSTTLVVSQRFECDAPAVCVDRRTFSVHAIVHGTRDDPFWQQMQAAMYQAASDMNVTFSMSLYETFSSNQMASDVSAVASMNPRPDALIVSVPDAVVQLAVGNLIQDTNQIVFGVNEGANVASAMGILGFISIGNDIAGRAAGELYLEARHNDTSGLRGLFVNPEYTDINLEKRFLAVKPALYTVQFDNMNLDDTDPTGMTKELTSSLMGCPFSYILLAKATPLSSLMSAMESNNCSYEDTFIGTFDVNDEVYEAIASDKLQFAISQQAYLQGATTVVVAALYVTTGKTFARSTESTEGNYLAGPILITKDKLPQPAAQTCESDAFPVCPNTTAADGSEAACACTDRSKLTFAGLTHGPTTDTFWDVVYAAAAQAGRDFNVQLNLIRLEPEVNPDDIYTKMVEHIRALCSSTDAPIDGLFVTLTNEQIVEAVQFCVSQNVPVIGINSGSGDAVKSGVLTFIGQAEYDAGYGAGQQFIDAGITRALCVEHVYNNSAVDARCQGMVDALKTAGSVTYLGTVHVPEDDEAEYIRVVEDAIGESGSWPGLGVLAAGGPQFPFISKVQESHADMIIGAFDTSPDIFAAIGAKKALFTIDQNAYLQGYWPVPFLTWYVTTNQALANQYIESGPRFVDFSPTTAEETCEKVFFEACLNSSGRVQSLEKSGGSRIYSTTVFLLATMVSVLVVVQ